MILVTGGAFCGKSHFIKTNYGVSDEDIISGEDFWRAGTEELKKYRVISNFEKYIEKLLREDEEIDIKKSVCNLLEDLLSVRNDIIIELREMGAGIVPVDKFERIFREAVGRCGCVIAEKSDMVYRVVCGIPVRIK